MDNRDFVELYKYNMRDYAVAVNEERAIPDARSGLKPIHTKIIYEMFVDKVLSNTKFRKNAYMVGQLLARFTPHGDAATYDALVRLAQPWVQRYPLIDFHGNYGSAFGDGPAAMRYTESKLAPIAEKGLLRGLDKDAVDWKMNFSNEEKEPVVLPALFPGLFCLPNQGMGYGCSCNFLTYNLQEVVEAIIEYLATGKVKTLAYDLASGGTIINPAELEKIKEKGKGSIIVEATYAIERNRIYFTELPFNQSFDSIFEKIAKLYEKGDLPHVKDFMNDSGKGSLRLTIICDNETHVEDTLSHLLDKTPLRTSYAINQVALVDGTPKLLSHKEMMDIYISHNLECIQREHQFDLNKTLDRIEILEGLKKAYDNLDAIISIIKESKSAIEAKNRLIELYDLTERQADAILALKLSKLAKLEKEEILNELDEKKKLAQYLKEVVASVDKQTEILIGNLRHLAEQFNSPRRTKVIQKTLEEKKRVRAKREIPIEDVVVALDNSGYIKSIPLGRFKTLASNHQEIKTSTDKMICLFSDEGKCYRIKVSSIKQGLNSEKGTALGSMLQLSPHEQITCFSVCGQNQQVFFATKMGKVKILNSEDMSGTTQNLKGMAAIKLSENDSLVFVNMINNNNFVTLSTEHRVLAFSLDEINPSGKASSGRKGISLIGDDTVIRVSLDKKIESNGVFIIPVRHIGTRGVEWTSF